MVKNQPSVLVVSSKYPPEYAGSGLRAHRTYLRLREKFGFRFSVLTNGLTHRANETYTLDGVQVHRIAGPFAGIRGGAMRRPRILGDAVVEWAKTEHWLQRFRSEIDLVHTFGNSWSVGAATLAAGRWRLPLLRELVNEMPDPYYPVQLRGRIRRVFEGDCAAMIAISRRLETLCREKRVRDCRYRLNPVEEERFNPREEQNPMEVRARHTRFSREDTVLVHVANYTPKKNHKFAVEVLARLPSQYKLVLGGPLREEERRTFEEVESTIRRLGVESRVDLQSGFIPNFEDYIRLADVFLFPTWGEAFGTPILEAQACARPVVANRMPGNTDGVIVPGCGGYEVPLDPEAWAVRVQEAAEIPRNVLVENAYLVLSRASTSTIDRWYANVIKEFAGKCRPADPGGSGINP